MVLTTPVPILFRLTCVTGNFQHISQKEMKGLMSRSEVHDRQTLVLYSDFQGLRSPMTGQKILDLKNPLSSSGSLKVDRRG